MLGKDRAAPGPEGLEWLMFTSTGDLCCLGLHMSPTTANVHCIEAFRMPSSLEELGQVEILTIVRLISALCRADFEVERSPGVDGCHHTFDAQKGPELLTYLRAKYHRPQRCELSEDLVEAVRANASHA